MLINLASYPIIGLLYVARLTYVTYVTDCLLQIKKMVYTGQGRSKLSSTLDGVTKAPYRCATCGEKFPRSDQLKYHMCDNHPELIEPGLRALLMKMRK